MRDQNLIFKYVERPPKMTQMMEYIEISYKDLSNIINNNYLSDNIGTYYLNLLQEREYGYNKPREHKEHCLFLKSILFDRVKYPLSKGCFSTVRNYLLKRLPSGIFFNVEGEIRLYPKTLAYIY